MQRYIGFFKIYYFCGRKDDENACYYILYGGEGCCERSELTHTHTHTHTQKIGRFGLLPIREHIHSSSFSVFREGLFLFTNKTNT